jgi:predicted transcriptional regulator
MEKLKAVIQHYPSPRSLVDALDVHGQLQLENVYRSDMTCMWMLGEASVKDCIAKIPYVSKNGAERTIGPAIGTVISKLYS